MRQPGLFFFCNWLFFVVHECMPSRPAIEIPSNREHVCVRLLFAVAAPKEACFPNFVGILDPLLEQLQTGNPQGKALSSAPLWIYRITGQPPRHPHHHNLAQGSGDDIADARRRQRASASPY